MEPPSDGRSRPASDTSDILSDTPHTAPSDIPLEDGSQTSQEETMPAHLAEKAESIRRACDLRDVDALVSYATSEGGLLRDDIRRTACQSLLHAMVDQSH